MRSATLRVHIPGNWIGCLSSTCDLSVRVLKCSTRNSEGGQSILQIDAPAELTQEELVRRIKVIEPRCVVQLDNLGPGRHLATVQLETCKACQLVSETGCFMDSATTTGDGDIHWNIVAPNAAALNTLVDKIKALGCTVTVDRISLLRTGSELTKAQEHVLAMAYELGYYEIPRKVTLAILAKRLEVSKATLDVILRRAERKLVADKLGRMA